MTDGVFSVQPLGEAVNGLDRLGITTRRHTSYESTGYLYSSAVDAISAAKRAST